MRTEQPRKYLVSVAADDERRNVEAICPAKQWRIEGGLGCSNPPTRNSEGPPKLCQTQPDLRKLLKIAEFRTSTPQDVRKKGRKILELPRFATVLYWQ